MQGDPNVPGGEVTFEVDLTRPVIEDTPAAEGQLREFNLPQTYEARYTDFPRFYKARYCVLQTCCRNVVLSPSGL